ncbi:hypothetical protein [Halomonas mongoliensis]|uniref:hypothetical protein n=1 Tax=Halomonas mongoliensis TaxID=321265 RepID=UPI00403AED6B
MAADVIPEWPKVNGTILHVGAGECLEWETYLGTPAEQIVLVEPDPELAQALRERASTQPRVQVIEAALAHQEGGATLHQYSLQGQSTLHPLPVQPLRWPGLKATSQVEVKALALNELLQSLALGNDKMHWLLLDVPGELLQALEALAGHTPAQPVEYLTLVTSPLSLEAEYDWPMLRKAIEKAGYRLEEITGQGDERVYHTRADALWKDSRRKSAELNSAQQRIEALTAELAELRNAGKQADEDKRHEWQIQLSHLQKRNQQLEQENQQLITTQDKLEKEYERLGEQLRKLEELIDAS